MNDYSSQLDLPFIADDQNRLDVETTTLIALRDSVGLALKQGSSATYKETMRLAEVLDPYLFHRDRSLLQKEWETPEEKECKAIANSRSVTFEAAVQSEIVRYQELLKNSTGRDASLFADKIERFRHIFQENRTDKFYEGKLIQRDANIGSNLPNSKEGNGYYDFVLSSNKGMRVRITHETEIENIIGTDLMYEHHDISARKARIAVVQYKIMEKEKYIPKSPKLKAQVERMSHAFCSELPCKIVDRANSYFRLPTCSAFLRSTHRLQSSNPKIMSTGFYIPVCRVSEVWSTNHGISEKTFEGELIRYRVFEELFNSSILGSRWLDYQELEDFYQKYHVLHTGDTVVMHFQVYE